MSATPAEARDEIFAAIAAAADGLAIPVLWPDKPGEPPATGAWCRAVLQHLSASKATLTDGTGGSRWRRAGTVIVQVFTEAGGGVGAAYDHAHAFLNALEGLSTPRGVILRNVRFSEVGPDGNWYQCNISAEFEYDEVK